MFTPQVRKNLLPRAELASRNACGVTWLQGTLLLEVKQELPGQYFNPYSEDFFFFLILAAIEFRKGWARGRS